MFDFLLMVGGIAGAAIAYFLSGDFHVCLVAGGPRKIWDPDRASLGRLAARLARREALDTIPGTTIPATSLAPGRVGCGAWSDLSKV